VSWRYGQVGGGGLIKSAVHGTHFGRWSEGKLTGDGTPQ
jgi:hypothetical protein